MRVVARLRRAAGQLSRLVSAPTWPQRPDHRVLIHLGCGSVAAEGFINVDLVFAPHVHIRTSLDDLSYFRDRTADMVYASHCLEHFSHLKTTGVLAEWVRLLKPGGLLRIAVPDFAVLVDAYRRGVELTNLQGYLLGAQNRPLNTHLALFDERTLRGHMEAAGLVAIRQWDPDKVADHAFVDDSSHRISINGESVLLSLNLEGTRP